MATTAKKSTAKKSTAKKTITVEMEMAKVTKNTYRFETDVEDAAISTLYVNKSAFDKEPTSITVTVTE